MENKKMTVQEFEDFLIESANYEDSENAKYENFYKKTVKYCIKKYFGENYNPDQEIDGSDYMSTVNLSLSIYYYAVYEDKKKKEVQKAKENRDIFWILVLVVSFLIQAIIKYFFF